MFASKETNKKFKRIKRMCYEMQLRYSNTLDLHDLISKTLTVPMSSSHIFDDNDEDFEPQVSTSSQMRAPLSATAKEKHFSSIEEPGSVYLGHFLQPIFLKSV